ncbi:MAG: hypothetical protein R3E75_10550 [Steroidobacteraceae bacterium]
MSSPPVTLRSAISLIFIGTLAAATAQPAEPVWKTFDPSGYSQRITACDRLAGHPEDPFKVVAGLEVPDMDLPAAIDICRKDSAGDPENPRLQYQLGRVLTYAGRSKEAMPHLQNAAAAKYPQALFVLGYLHAEGFAGVTKDTCKAASYLREAGQYGRMAGILALPAYALEGRFKGCESAPDSAEIAAFLTEAKSRNPSFAAGLLIDALQRAQTN